MIEVGSDFSGVVSVSSGDVVEFEQAYGLADRAHGVPFAADTRCAIASATKGFTALAVLSLVLDGALTLDAPVRPVLGADLPLIADDVTVEHLLTHRSGIGDYCDEDLPEYQPPNVPVQALESTEDYLPALEGFPAKFAAGTRFSYCNSGYVVLALVAERVAGVPFADLLRERVWRPAGMESTGFLRSDELPGDAAIGYLDNGRTNVFMLPVVGTGDGGAYANAPDLRAFWTSLFGGVFEPRCVSWLTTPGDMPTGHPYRYGMGLWLAASGPVALLEGCDQGVSFRSWHDPTMRRTVTVVSNTTDGAWPVARGLARDVLPIPRLSP